MNVDLEHIAIVITALVSIGGMITGFLALKSQKKKDVANASESIAEAAKSLIEPLRQRIEHLEQENVVLRKRSDVLELEIGDLKKTLRAFKEGTERLVYQLRALNAEPVWQPNEIQVGGEDES